MQQGVYHHFNRAIETLMEEKPDSREAECIRLIWQPRFNSYYECFDDRMFALRVNFGFLPFEDGYSPYFEFVEGNPWGEIKTENDRNARLTAQECAAVFVERLTKILLEIKTFKNFK